jgi:hypothetical protein
MKTMRGIDDRFVSTYRQGVLQVLAGVLLGFCAVILAYAWGLL